MKYLIETERLVLRDLEPGDEDTLAAMLADEEVMRWIGAGGAQVGDVARRVIERERGHYAERGWGEWATTERDSGRMIGLCGLILWPDIEGREELEVPTSSPATRGAGGTPPRRRPRSARSGARSVAAALERVVVTRRSPRRNAEPASPIRRCRIPPTSSPRPRRPEPSR